MGRGEIQSNVEIAGSPRNSFRASLREKIAGGRALIRRGTYPVTKPSQTRMAAIIPGSQTATNKGRSQRETAQTIS